MASAKDIGRRVRQAREEAGLSREELAVATKLSYPRIERIELGNMRSFKPDVLQALADATGKTPGWFFEAAAAVAMAGALL